MPATLSILGLYQYDPGIFNDLQVPGGVDKATVIDNILYTCAEFEILYPDPLFMRTAIAAWSRANQLVWDHLYSTTLYNYDPIANYDRTETYNDVITDDGSSTRTPNTTDEITHGMTVTQAQNSFENAGMVDAIKSTDGGKDTTTHTGTDKIETGNERTISHSARMYGNIGVTTTQQMIEQEREIAEFNIYNRICDDFKMRFCLMIY